MVRTSEQVIFELSTGEKVYRYQDALVIPFDGRYRKVMSTVTNNGGYRDNLTAVYNHKSKYGYCGYEEDAPMPYELFIRDYVKNTLLLDYNTVAGMATIVSMENVSIRSQSYQDLQVTALTTASLEVNGGRVCDPACFFEEKGKKIFSKIGTINIFLFVSANMIPGSMARAIVTLTEAKTAAIQELMGESVYTHRLATGSGSDSAIVVANGESDHLLTYAGKHGKLGEMIGYTVKESVKEALGKHMNLTEETQHSIFRRMHRFGINQENYNDFPVEIDHDGYMVSLTSLYAHTLDQLDWELISSAEAGKTCAMLIRQMGKYLKIDSGTVSDSPGMIPDLIRRFSKFLSSVNNKDSKKN
jgi:adenosylcobinamide amidohydrolase